MQNETKVLSKRFGADVRKLQLDEITKGKIKSVNYGTEKKRETNIREVCDKTAFDRIGQLFDVKEIRNHRRLCCGVRTYLKSLKKFKDCL